jgi:hypothetical protein
MNAYSRYKALQAELAEIEKSTGLYLADENVDAENCANLLPMRILSSNVESDNYWNAMHSAACSAAGQRAEDAGKDINALIGRVIY